MQRSRDALVRPHEFFDLTRVYDVAVEISSDPSGAPVVTVCPPKGCP
jgi:hypothetical protein